MNFSALPTDNLYKFMSLAGLVIIFLSIYIPVSIIDTLSVRLALLEQEAEVAQAKVDFTDELSEHYQKIVDARKNENLDHGLGNSQFSREKLSQFSKEVNDLILENRIDNAKLRGSTRSANLLIVKVSKYRKGAYLGLLIGFFLTYFGFRFWYTRVQLKLDQELEHRVGQINDKPSS